MDRFSSKHISTVLIGVLVIINLALLGTIWYKFVRTPRFPFGPLNMTERTPGIPDPNDRIKFEEGLKRFLKQEIGFSTAQQEKFLELQRRHLENVRKTHRQISELRKDLMDSLFNEDTDHETIDRTAAEIGEITVSHEKSVLNHFRALAEICTPEQQVKYKKLLHQILEQLTPKGNRNPPPPGDGQLPPPGHRPPPRNG